MRRLPRKNTGSPGQMPEFGAGNGGLGVANPANMTPKKTTPQMDDVQQLKMEI